MEEETKQTTETTQTTEKTVPTPATEKTADELRQDILDQETKDKSTKTEETIEEEEAPSEEEIKEEDKQDDKVEDQQKTEDKEEEEFDPFEQIDENKSETTEEDEEDPLTEEERAIIDRRVNKIVGGKLQALDKMQREASFTKFLNSKEGELYKPFESEISKYIHDPRFKGFKFEAIGNMVAGRSLIKMGAEKYKTAMIKSNKSRTGGSAPRKPAETTGIPDTSNMSTEEFEKFTQQVKSGKFQG